MSFIIRGKKVIYKWQESPLYVARCPLLYVARMSSISGKKVLYTWQECPLLYEARKSSISGKKVFYTWQECPILYRCVVQSVRLVVGRPEFDSMAESDQKTLKLGIHSFPAWRSALKRVSVKIGRQVHLLCPWIRHLTGLPLPLSG